MKKKISSVIIIISLLSLTMSNSQWQVQTTTNAPIFDIFFTNSNTGWAVGAHDKIFYTTNGGANWNLQFTGNPELLSITFIDQYTGWAVSGNWYPSPYSFLYKTTNSGMNWSSMSIPNRQIVTVCFPDSFTGWIAGGYGSLYGILKSTDGGITWNSQQSNTRVADLFFLDVNTGWLAGNVSMKTTNGGLNWNVIQNGTTHQLESLYFLNSNTGWGVSINNIDKTTNGGSSWFSQYYNNNITLTDVRFTDLNTGWAVGGTYPDGIVLKTTNSGLNWNQQYCTSSGHDGDKRSIFCFNSNILWIGGGENYGVIYGTTNGGEIVGIQPINNNIPVRFSLKQNFPNPFNPQTKIGFDISESSKTKIVVYDVYGKVISVLFDETLKPGSYELTFNGESLASSVYFYSIITKYFTETKKMILLK